MSKIVLFEDARFANLLPVLYWRTVFEIRCGRESLGERIERLSGAKAAGLWTRAWLAEVAAERSGLAVNEPVAAGDILVNGRWLPAEAPVFPSTPTIGRCEDEIAYIVCDEELAKRLGPEHFLDPEGQIELIGSAPADRVGGSMIGYPWDLIAKNIELLASDPVVGGVDSEVHALAALLNTKAIRIEAGARVLPGAVIDATDGPIVIEAGVRVGPHACISGPAHIAAGTVINPGAHIHGGTSIGPRCKVGGEVNACVFQGFSNKQHDGFLGHSFVGSWVNLGAGTVNSDLKNTYGSVRVPLHGEMTDTGQMFVGAIIGDYTKMAIHTTIPTGAVLGFGVNVAYSRTLPQFVGSFSWITDRGISEGDPERLVGTARKTMARRDVELTEAEAKLFDKLPHLVAYFEPAVVAQQRAFDAAPDVTPLARTQTPETR